MRFQRHRHTATSYIVIPWQMFLLMHKDSCRAIRYYMSLKTADRAILSLLYWHHYDFDLWSFSSHTWRVLDVDIQYKCLRLPQSNYNDGIIRKQQITAQVYTISHRLPRLLKCVPHGEPNVANTLFLPGVTTAWPRKLITNGTIRKRLDHERNQGAKWIPLSCLLWKLLLLYQSICLR